jgi:hypothetical protein
MWLDTGNRALNQSSVYRLVCCEYVKKRTVPLAPQTTDTQKAKRIKSKHMLGDFNQPRVARSHAHIRIAIYIAQYSFDMSPKTLSVYPSINFPSCEDITRICSYYGFTELG